MQHGDSVRHCPCRIPFGQFPGEIPATGSRDLTPAAEDQPAGMLRDTLSQQLSLGAQSPNLSGAYTPPPPVPAMHFWMGTGPSPLLFGLTQPPTHPPWLTPTPSRHIFFLPPKMLVPQAPFQGIAYFQRLGKNNDDNNNNKANESCRKG